MAREYDIAKAAEHCCKCEREMAPAEEFMAALVDAGETFRRDDFCLACWEARDAESDAALFSVWRCRAPEPEKPQRQLVGNEALMDMFEKLGKSEEPAKLNFRFVLALMLMRKKLLVYVGSAAAGDGRETWTMHWKNRDDPIAVVNPQLDDDKIAQVAEQLGALFETPS